MKVTKEEKKIQKKIESDIDKMRNKDYPDISYNVKKIESYYARKKFSEEILFYRLDKIKTFGLFKEVYFGFAIGVLFTYVTKLVDPDYILNISFIESIRFIIISIISFTAVLLYVKDSSSPINGRDNYLNEKEIEIITSIIEGNKKLNTGLDDLEEPVEVLF